MPRLKGYIYTCDDCHFQWEDAREEAYASVPCDFGCQKCRGKNISFKEKETVAEESKGANIIRGKNLGSIKKDEGFKEVLNKIKDNYPGSTIDV